MTEMQRSDEAKPATADEVTALDQVLDGLRRRETAHPDPTLDALRCFADAVDQRARELIESSPQLQPQSLTAAQGAPLTPDVRLTDRSARPARSEQRVRPARPARSNQRRRRLWVTALGAGFALSVTGTAAALSGNPSAPLYPLHQLFFDASQNSEADRARSHLSDARRALDHAAASTGAARTAALTQARHSLREAQDLLPHITDQNDRNHIAADLSDLESRADRVDAATPQPPTSPPPTPSPGRPSASQSGDRTNTGQTSENQTGGPTGPDARNGNQGTGPGPAQTGGQSSQIEQSGGAVQTNGGLTSGPSGGPMQG